MLQGSSKYRNNCLLLIRKRGGANPFKVAKLFLTRLNIFGSFLSPWLVLDEVVKEDFESLSNLFEH